MHYSLHITQAPYQSQSPTSALLFAKALLRKGHTIDRIFFSGDGVHNGSALCTPPQDEINIVKEWQAIAHEQETELIVCVAGALKRGIIDQAEAERYQLAHFNLAEGFIISGLGQLVEACVKSDRMLSFI